MEQESSDNLVKITDICRACLTKTENMKFLLESSEEIINLLSKFAAVANMEIELGFKYPSYLCTICEEKIINSYEFQQQCQKSNDLVYEYLAVFAKEETVSIEPESEILSKNFNFLEQVNILQVPQVTTESLDPQCVEIANTIINSPCENNDYNKAENNENFQDKLNSAILNLKEKYSHNNVCAFCPFQAPNIRALSAHVSRIHKDSKSSWCSVCNKLFSSVEAHSEETHKNDFTCQVCQLQCSTFKSTIQHLQSHQDSSQNSHIETDTAFQVNKNICQVCNETCDSEELLKTHAKTHLARCKFCNKIFSTNTLLQNHKCNRVRRKNNKGLNNGLKNESNTLQIEIDKSDFLEKQKRVSTYDLSEQFKNFNPKEVPVRNKALQRMRLKQYSVEDVEKAISIVRGKFYRHVTCIFCSFKAITNRSLSVHVTRVHREYKGKWCSSCNQICENQTVHNKEIHHEDLKCPFCKMVKANMGHFMEHLASHSVERLHKCDICFKSFISPRHLRIHKEKTHVLFKCGLCEKAFLKAMHLKIHLKVHQNSEKGNDPESIENDKVSEEEINENHSFKSDDAEETSEKLVKPHNYCKECNKKVRSLPIHYNTFHNANKSTNAEKQNLCPHCGKRFKTRSKLTVHIRTHTGETPYKCQYCDKRVKTRNILVVHERTHTGEKPYMCTVCGKSFAQSSVLNTHTRIHTGRPEQCTICEKRFCRPAELRLHMRKHTGEKPYICHHCGQGFKQKSHLVEHTKTHTDDRPYKCEYCEKTFKSSGTLKCHVQIHTGQKPFKCSQCSYACRQPYSLTQHMTQHDTDTPQPNYPHICQLCQRNYATMAHLTAHHNRFHSGINMKSLENMEQPSVNNEAITSEILMDRETNRSNQNENQMVQENQMANSDQIQTVESVENVDAMIIQTESDVDDIKFEPMIQFTTLRDL